MICVLLTLTIHVKNMMGVKQRNIQERITTYKKSIQQWGELNLPYKIYILENSNYGNPFKELLKENVIYISYDGIQDPKRGKGYGEAHTELYFVENIIDKDDKYIVKFTGRWAPINDSIFHKFEKIINNEEIISGISKFELTSFQHLHDIELVELTRWFVVERSCFKDFLKGCVEKCDDRKGEIGWYESVFFEFFKNKHMKHLENYSIEVVNNPDGSFNKLTNHI